MFKSLSHFEFIFLCGVRVSSDFTDFYVSVELSHFKEEFSFLLNEDLTNKSMYDLIRTKHQIAFDCSRKTIEIVFATYELAKYLNVSSGYPLLLICSDLVSLETNTNICFNRQYILGDRFRLMV